MLAANCADEYELEEVNINDDPSLTQLYGTEIPVITINGTQAFKHRLTAAQFKKALRSLESGVWSLESKTDSFF
jgi:hypothetical protein